jgi:hypothetical protein
LTHVVIRPDDDRLRSKHVAFNFNKTVVLDVCYFTVLNCLAHRDVVHKNSLTSRRVEPIPTVTQGTNVTHLFWMPWYYGPICEYSIDSVPD